MIRRMSLPIILLILFLLNSCSSGPSDQEIVTALKASFNKGKMPQCFVRSLLGGGIYPESIQIEILKKGGLIKESPKPFMPGNYYPARVRVKGKGFGTMLFGEKKDHEFDSTFEIQMRKGDYNEWTAEFDPFNCESNKIEAQDPTSASTPTPVRALPKFTDNINDESNIIKLLNFIDKNRGRSVNLNITIANNQLVDIAPRGKYYEDADSLTFWNSERNGGSSFLIRGDKHQLIQNDGSFLLSGTFEIDKQAEMHQGIQSYLLVSQMP